MKTIIITQARMTSTRLPGKVLKEVLGKTLLEYQIERLRRVTLADEVVVATTINSTDIPIVELCNKLSVPCYRGSEEDVLSRYFGAAKEYQANIVVRVTSDCPLIEPQVIDKLIKYYLNYRHEYHYVSNTIERTYPRGMDTEVFSYQTLEEINLKAVAKPDREHVTPFIYRHPEKYRLANISSLDNQSSHRWTVDTPEDLELISKIISSLYPSNPLFTLNDCLLLLSKNPGWKDINLTVEQKVYGR